MIFIFLFEENCLKYNSIHDFAVWLRIGSNLAVINRVWSHIQHQECYLDIVAVLLMDNTILVHLSFDFSTPPPILSYTLVDEVLKAAL